jgi:hypothetical protein
LRPGRAGAFQGAPAGFSATPKAAGWLRIWLMVRGCGPGLVLLLLLVARELCAGAAPALRPGSEVFAVEPARVLEVSYRTSTFQVLAHRFRTGEAFRLILLRSGQPRPEWCEAGEGWQRVLRRLTSLPLSRIPSRGEVEALLSAQPLVTWGELAVRDDSLLEPFRARLLPVDGSPGEVWLHTQGTTCRVALPHEVLELLAGGCQTLARHKTAQPGG